jgi:spore coat protein U-like protein
MRQNLQIYVLPGAFSMKYSYALKTTLSAAILGCLALGIASTPAFAGTATANIAVSANVATNCTVTAAPLAFGSYTGAVNNYTANLTITCTNTTTYNVGLGVGLASGATVTTRQMQNGTALLNYTLLTGSYTGTNWGNTTGSWVSGVGTGAAQTLPVYGVIAAGQFVTPGAYTDTIIATVNY